MLFRKEALEAKRNIWVGKVLLLNTLPVWVIFILTSAFFVVMFTFIIFGEYSSRVSVTGEIVSVPRSVTVFSSHQGFIISHLINVGDKIKKGQQLYQIDVSHSSTLGVVSKNQKLNIENQINTVDKIINRINLNKKATLNALSNQKKSYEHALKNSSLILKKAEAGLGLMKQNMENYRLYLNKGLITKDQLTNQTVSYYQQQNELLSLSSQNEQNALQVMTLQSSIQTQAVDFDNQVNQLEIQKNELERKLSEADASGTIIITSPVDGVVDSLSVTSGQMVNEGDSLIQIIPGEITKYILVLWVPGYAAPYVSPNEKINIHYDAFPAEKFGQFPGDITSVSSSPASIQEMATYPSSSTRLLGAPQAWYKVIVKPRNDFFVYQGKIMNYENGMKATSIVFLENRKIYQWILSPLYNIRNSLGGPVSDQK